MVCCADSLVHLHVHSQYSFLDGASDCTALVSRCAELGMGSLAITDHNNVSCAVEFARAAAEHGVKPIQGVELTMADGSHMTLLAQDPEGYANICRILTDAYMSSDRRNPRAPISSLQQHSSGIIALSGCRFGAIPRLLLTGDAQRAHTIAAELARIFGKNNFFIELQHPMVPGAAALNSALAGLAQSTGLGIVAANNVHYVHKQGFDVHDVLTCIRTLTTLDDIHPERHMNAENYMKSPQQMAAMFAPYPQAIANTVLIAERCRPGLDLTRRLFPKYTPPAGETAASFLWKLTMEGAAVRYSSITPAIRSRLEHELNIITTLGFEDYFLAVHDIASWARQQGIRCAGRGSAADSAVAYCLRLTNVDSIARGLLFERFMSLERAQRPDIDIDFQSDRRDDVAAYVYGKYGQGYVASVCTFSTFQARSAVRDIGKALSFPENDIDRFAKILPHIPADGVRAAFSRYPELRDSGIPPHKFELLLNIAESLAGFPRHIGTHLGGLVISGQPLACVTPLQMSAKGVAITQFDKDSIEDLGLIKLDLLSLRTLSAVEYAEELICDSSPEMSTFSYDTIPSEDGDTYSMIRTGETIGVFQLESPSQRALQSRLGADSFEDIVASVALIRPGPIKGNMVEPFVARRQGKEDVSYIDPRLEPILRKTYGVVLYQEQVIEIATAVAGFTPGESDRLRKVMTHYRSVAEMEAIGNDFVAKAVAQGTDRQVAETIFSHIVGYAGYGFCEAHAAAFADTTYRTAFLVRHFPAQFFASILSSQPMGYYPARTLIVEAKRRGIEVLPLDINESEERYTAYNGALRVGLMQVKGISKQHIQAIVRARTSAGPFTSASDFASRVAVPEGVFLDLALAGAFDSIEPNRRALVWRISQISSSANEGRRINSTAHENGQHELLTIELPAASEAHNLRNMRDYTEAQLFINEVQVLGFCVNKHAMEFYRPALAKWGALTAAQILKAKPGQVVRGAGLVLRPRRPPTKSGRTVVFISLEDETGIADMTVFENVYQTYGSAIFTSAALLVEGTVTERGGGISIIARRIKQLKLKCGRGQGSPGPPQADSRLKEDP